MGERKLRNGVSWQGALKQNVKQVLRVLNSSTQNNELEWWVNGHCLNLCFHLHIAIKRVLSSSLNGTLKPGQYQLFCHVRLSIVASEYCAKLKSTAVHSVSYTHAARSTKKRITAIENFIGKPRTTKSKSGCPAPSHTNANKKNVGVIRV
jgi:hypothetical protein